MRAHPRGPRRDPDARSSPRATSTALEDLSEVVAEEGGDTVFAIDRVSEAVLVDRFAEIAREWPCLLIAEGLGADGRRILPAGTDPARGRDRGDRRSHRRHARSHVPEAPGLDPHRRGGDRGPRSRARSAARAASVGHHARRTDGDSARQTAPGAISCGRSRAAARAPSAAIASTGARTPLALRPSAATTTLQGFGGLSRFFPGGREELSAIDDAIALALLGPPRAGVALSFEDQYISSGGQLYELTVGHDRWVADVRPLVDAALRRRGQTIGVCSHPYDLCTELIAREAGVIVTDPRGGRLDAPLDVFSDVGWIGYRERDATRPDRATFG